MGPDPIPFMEYLFPYYFENKQIRSTEKKSDLNKASSFANTFIDDLYTNSNVSFI